VTISRAIAAAAAWVIAGCGGAPAPSATEEASPFACNERRAEYVVAGGFGALERGVVIECTETSATLARWRRDQADGEPQRTTRPLPVPRFESLWAKVQTTGWRNLGDCENPAAAPGDPLYTFYVSDHIDRASFTCVGKTLPFPYDSLVTELDLAAAATLRD
jgi:hypothetical protein